MWPIRNRSDNVMPYCGQLKVVPYVDYRTSLFTTTLRLTSLLPYVVVYSFVPHPSTGLRRNTTSIPLCFTPSLRRCVLMSSIASIAIIIRFRSVRSRDRTQLFPSSNHSLYWIRSSRRLFHLLEFEWSLCFFSPGAASSDVAVQKQRVEPCVMRTNWQSRVLLEEPEEEEPDSSN
jgi:hypothetical protein